MNRTKPVLLLFLLFTSVSSFAGGVPRKMPDDFMIRYHSHIGYNTHYREIEIKLGECKVILEPTEEAKENSYSFNINKEDLSSLYSALRTLRAFTLKSKPAKYGERGGERVDYTIAGKTYVVSNYGSSFVIKSHYDHFIDSIDLITAYADRNRH